MRSLRDFIESRMGQVEINGPVDLCRRARISKPTFYKIVDDPDHSNKGKRELIAAVLLFKGWDDLLDAHRTDDVMRGLVERRVSRASKAFSEFVSAPENEQRQLFRELPQETIDAIEALIRLSKHSGRRRREAAKPRQKP